jgi:hypothetical protein
MKEENIPKMVELWVSDLQLEYKLFLAIESEWSSREANKKTFHPVRFPLSFPEFLMITSLRNIAGSFEK